MNIVLGAAISSSIIDALLLFLRNGSAKRNPTMYIMTMLTVDMSRSLASSAPFMSGRPLNTESSTRAVSITFMVSELAVLVNSFEK